MVLNDFQRGKLPYYVKPPGIEKEPETSETTMSTGETEMVQKANESENLAEQTKLEESTDKQLSENISEYEVGESANKKINKRYKVPMDKKLKKLKDKKEKLNRLKKLNK